MEKVRNTKGNYVHLFKKKHKMLTRKQKYLESRYSVQCETTV